MANRSVLVLLMLLPALGMPSSSTCDASSCAESEKIALSADDESGSVHLLQRVKSGGSKELAAENETLAGTCVQAELDCPGRFNPNAKAHCSQAALGCGGGGCTGERTCSEAAPDVGANGQPLFKVCCFVHAKCTGNDLILGGGRRRRRVKKSNCENYEIQR